MLMQYSSSVATVISDTNLIPANDTWHPKIPNIVYFGMDWDCPSYNEVRTWIVSPARHRVCWSECVRKCFRGSVEEDCRAATVVVSCRYDAYCMCLVCHGGRSGPQALADRLKYYYGNITAENTIYGITSIVQTGDVHIGVYDLTDQVGLFVYRGWRHLCRPVIRGLGPVVAVSVDVRVFRGQDQWLWTTDGVRSTVHATTVEQLVQRARPRNKRPPCERVTSLH